MKILYVGKFCHEWSTENYVTYALRSLGAEVIKRPFTRGLTLAGLQSQVERTGVNIVLFSKPSTEWFPKLIQWCRERGILTVVWLWDQYFGRRLVLPWSISADLFFSTDGGHLQEWIANKVNHQVLRQGIHRPENILYALPPSHQFQHDVGFVGDPNSYPQRKQMVAFLQATYGDRFIVHTRTRRLALNRALAQVKVIVGDSYPSPDYWSNRIYEITGRGGFFLHPTTEGLDRHFTPSVHYVPFERGNYAQIKEIADYYINNDAEREKILVSGFLHCRAHHTYEHRVEILLKQIQEFKTKQPLPALGQSLTTLHRDD